LMEPAKGVPVLSVIAAQAKTGNLSFFAINRDSEKSISLRIRVDSFWCGAEIKASASVLTAPKMTSPPEEMSLTRQDLTLKNGAGDPHRANVVYEFPPRSVAVLRLARMESR